MISSFENSQKPFCPGFGLGLRPEHYEEILQQKPPIDWFEIISENYLVAGGRPLANLDEIRKHYPMVMHGVSLSVGSSDPLDFAYLKQLKALASRIEPRWISDHLCWTGVHGMNMHDLLPLAYTVAAIDHIVSRIQQVQDYLGRQILIENVSSYLTFTRSEMAEWEFIREILERADCYLLLDINNIYVSALNHGFDAQDYLNALPAERVLQIHLAGHSNKGDYLIDTHDAPVSPEVWDLYATAIRKFGPVATMIERDDNIPPLADLLTELQIARDIMRDNLPEATMTSSGILPPSRGQATGDPENHAYQTALQNYLLDGQEEEGCFVVQTGKLSSATRLGIYRDGYTIRLLDALANNYPCLKQYVGEAVFQEAGSAYIAENPSSYRSIRWFGDRFANFLSRYTPQSPWLSELARFEWGLTMAFDAADDLLLQVEELIKLPAELWANLRFTLHSSVQRFDFCWNTVAIWKALSTRQTVIDAEKNPQSWLLWRRDYINHFHALSVEEAFAIDALIQGLSFGEICEGLCQWIDEEQVGMRAATFLKGWIQSDLLSGVKNEKQGQTG